MADYSIYPVAIDGYAQIPLVVDDVTRVDAVTVNRLRSAIVNIEVELGVQPSSTYDTVSDRIAALENAIDNLGDGVDVTALIARIEDLENNVDSILIRLDEIEAIVDGLSHKNPVRVATTENISNLNSGAPLVVDSITLQAGNRVLVFNQTTQSQNGIYEVITAGSGSNGVWSRADDANSATNLIPGSEVFVLEGTLHGLAKYWLVTTGPYTIGTTSLEFLQGLQIMASDAAPTTILTATTLGSSFALATETDSIAVRGFKEVDFSFTATNIGSITEIRIRILYSLLASPGDYSTSPEDWNILLAEDIASGVGTIDPYTLSIDASTYPSLTSLPGSFALRSPVSGLHMMLLIWAEAGSPASSSFVGRALRRA
jgi:hypothetical protein